MNITLKRLFFMSAVFILWMDFYLKSGRTFIIFNTVTKRGDTIYVILNIYIGL